MTPGDRGGGAWGVAGRTALEPPGAARGVGLRAPLGPAPYRGVFTLVERERREPSAGQKHQVWRVFEDLSIY